MKSRLLLISALALTLCSCQQNTFTPEFLEDDTIRMEVGKNAVFTYDPTTCQYAYNTGRCEFRAHTDNVSNYFIVKLDHRPAAENEEVTATYLEWIERRGTDKVKKNVTLQVVKLEGDNIWLWSSRENIRLSILLP